MEFETARARLVDYLSTQIKDQRVLAVMARVPRERFVPPDSQNFAYEDRPLPIGLDQTISQPLIIAMMTEALELTGKEKVLEIGTGSGYQTAILAKLSRNVVTVERLAPLVEKAEVTLKSLGYTNIAVHLAQETLGWPDEAPYDAIMVTAAAPRLPADILAQLSLRGRLVIPIGSRHVQELYKIARRGTEKVVENLGGCCFVPLIGKEAWENE